MLARLVRQLLGQLLDQMAATKRINHMCHIRFILQMDLGVTGDPGGVISGQPQGLVKRVCMQRLGMTRHRCGRFNTGARHIIEHILGGQ